MNFSIIDDLDTQIHKAQESLNLLNSLKEKVIRLECEKDEAVNKCKLLEAKLIRLKEENCLKCPILLNKLNEERTEKERLKKEEKAKLLKAIVKTLEEDGTSNQMSNAQQLLTQLVFDGCESSRSKTKINLIDETVSSDEDSSKVIVDETIVEIESEDSSNDFKQQACVIVPETEMQGFSKNSVNKLLSRPPSHKITAQENRSSLNEKPEIQHVAKKSKCEEVLSLTNEKKNLMSSISPTSPSICPEKGLINKENERSPPVLTTETRNEVITVPDEQSTIWKMKPSFLLDSSVGATSSKRFKQMTLSVTRPEKKKDISLSGKFNGGLANDPTQTSDEEKDVVLPSPNLELMKFFRKKHETSESLEDPDLTIFHPNAASTCIPMETSFDKLPEQAESPPYKYRRDTVRKKEKRMKLPGQNCDECEKYYRAAGLNETKELMTRMNVCSRHRDKYAIRAHTPPGFWDPVFPITPKGGQEDS